MPFKDVSTTSNYPKIEGSITVEVLDIEDADPGQFGDRIKWVFKVWDDYGEAVTWQDGEEYEWWQYTSTSLSPKSIAGKWAQALLGRALADGEQGADIAQAVIGKRANAFSEVSESGYSSIKAMSPSRDTAEATEETAELF